jgi:hypothetical protein
MLATDRVFIVPEVDLDCDEAKAECNEYAFDGNAVPPIEKSTCTTPSKIGDAEVCKIGGQVCSDLTGNAPGCAPSDYCLPDFYCPPATAASPCTFDAAGMLGDLRACLFAPAQRPPTMLKCQVPMKTASNAPRRLEPCQTSFEFDLTSNPSIRCIGPEDELMLQAPLTDAPLAFAHYAELPTTDGTTIHNARVALRYKFDQCKYKVEIEGLFADQTIDRHTFAQFWTQRVGGQVRKLLVPFELQAVLDDTCMLPPKCTLTLAPNETLAQCAAR